MARPKENQGSVQRTISVPGDLDAWLVAEAERQMRSVSNLVITVIAQAKLASEGGGENVG